MTHAKMLLYTIFLLRMTVSAMMLPSIGKMVDKVRQMYKTKSHKKGPELNYLGYDPNEYPPSNDLDRLEHNKQLWDEYYHCLKQQEDSLAGHGAIVPEALVVFEGQPVLLQCKVCLSPAQLDTPRLTQWYFASEENDRMLPLDMGQHIIISAEDATLHLYDLQLDQSGQYVCQQANHATAPYFLTVVSDSEPLRHVRRFTGNYTPESPWLFGSDRFVLDTFWSLWSPCSNCDVVGNKHRMGYCTLNLLENMLDADQIPQKDIVQTDIIRIIIFLMYVFIY